MDGRGGSGHAAAAGSPRNQVVDVGANVGLYSLLLGRLVGKCGCVYSFEPEPQLCATLRDNCASNGVTNVVPFEYAAGPSNARQRFRRATFNSGNNTLDRGPSQTGTLEETVVRIDDILPVEKIDFVKIDVQGHELGALAGMERLLSSNPDVRVFFEFWPSGLLRPEDLTGIVARFLSRTRLPALRNGRSASATRA